jgi:hypothetical protein
LRSLIDCLFGTSDSKTAIEAGWDGKSIKISYEKYPTLPEMLMKLLSQVVNPNTKITSEISTVESVFPALDIIRRAGPPTTHGDEIFKLVLNHLGSRVWNVREMSSHAISVLVPQTTWVETTRDLLKTLNTSHNFRHGSLMAVRFILERQTIMDGGYTLGMYDGRELDLHQISILPLLRMAYILTYSPKRGPGRYCRCFSFILGSRYCLWLPRNLHCPH